MTEYSDSPKTNSRDIENSPHKNPKNRPQKKLYIYIYISSSTIEEYFLEEQKY
jgi:hypothetical protein